jgi:hypothetical protein
MKKIILTDEEWMSIINMERDGLPVCCANISDLRDRLITVARDDGEVFFPEKLKESIKFVLDGHDNLPLIEKIRDTLDDK